MIILFFIFGTIHIYRKNLFNPSGIVKSFEKAIKTKNYDALQKIILIDNSSKNFNLQTLSPFVNYLIQNPNMLVDLITNLKLEANLLENKFISLKDNPIKNNETLSQTFQDTVHLIENPNSYKKNKRYLINLKTISLNLPIPTKDCKIFINGKEHSNLTFEGNNSVSIHGLLMGKYIIDAKYEDDNLTLEDSAEADLYSNGSYASVNLLKDKFNTISLSTNVYNAKLFVNNKEIKYFKSGDTFGPVIKGMKLQATTNINGEEIKSNEVIWNGESISYLNFDNLNKYNVSFNSENRNFETPNNILDKNNLEKKIHYCFKTT